MEIIKGSLADNSQVEQPYRTKGKIFLDENGNIMTIYVKGILVDFEIITPLQMDIVVENDKAFIKLGWVKVLNQENDLTEWIMTDNLSSEEWDGKERNYFDF